VREIGPRIALVNSWNERQPEEEVSAEWSNDIEPVATPGHTYLDFLNSEIALSKGSWRSER
jgi:hypothetical protein